MPSVAAAKDRAGQEIRGEIRFELYKGYLIVVKGSIGPLKGLHFLVDTGASTTLLDSRVAARLGLDGEPADVNIIFYRGIVRSRHSWAPSVELGPLRVFHRPVLLQDLSVFGDTVPVHIDAVVGLDVLGRAPFLVDYRRSTIYFGPLPHLPVSIPLSQEEGLAMVKADVNHAAAQLIFDTGTPSLLIFGSRIPKVTAGLKTQSSKIGETVRSSSAHREVRISALHLGQAEFGRQRAIVLDARDEGGREFDGVLSPAALHLDAFSLDLNRGALELRPGI